MRSTGARARGGPVSRSSARARLTQRSALRMQEDLIKKKAAVNKSDICSLNNSLAILILLGFTRFPEIIAGVKYSGVRSSDSPAQYLASDIDSVAR